MKKPRWVAPAGVFCCGWKGLAPSPPTPSASVGCGVAGLGLIARQRGGIGLGDRTALLVVHLLLARRASWKAMPVPAGIRRPTMTFSFRPRSSSRLPMIAASVRTRVVSWKEAAEMKESVDSEALVMPSSTLL